MKKENFFEKVLRKIGLTSYKKYKTIKNEHTMFEFHNETLRNRNESLERQVKELVAALNAAQKKQTIAAQIIQDLIDAGKENSTPPSEIEIRITPKFKSCGVDLEIATLPNGKFAPILGKCPSCGTTRTKISDERNTYLEARDLANAYKNYGFGVNLKVCDCCK